MTVMTLELLLSKIDVIIEKVDDFPDDLRETGMRLMVDALLERSTPLAYTEEPVAHSVPAESLGNTVVQAQDSRNYATEIHQYYSVYGLDKRNDMEVASFLAHYLINLAPEDARVEAIEPENFEDLCKITGRALPKDARSTLSNAKNKRKYLESDGKGGFTLSTIGEHYVKHTLLKKNDE